MQPYAPIGVFDSGSGGLTVVKQLHKILPNEDIIYVGDLKRLPYGPRDPQEIIKFMYQFLNFFAVKKVKMAVFACNTMTSWGYDKIDGKLPYLSVPMSTAIGQALLHAPNKKIGVIATEATINKGFHREMVNKTDKEASIVECSCPDFVPLIEAGHINDSHIDKAAEKYLQIFSGKHIESLILGCTHYPIIKRELIKYLDQEVTLIDPAVDTAWQAKATLERNNLKNNRKKKGRVEFFFSASLQHAAAMVKIVLAMENPIISEINLEKFN
ncbi:glutamate racemase [Pectinatus sottacetonis]|uniref:glutamate racemase n=1 Tax=Pectinatus sottacetonis TaxID=1002795 RepID=UPI0018C5B856|nr:glutamate racemase [Pectinatus sottacetonis]